MLSSNQFAASAPAASDIWAAEQPLHAQLIQMAVAIWTARAVYATAQLQITDLLAQGPRHVDDLACATGTHPRSLHRLLRAVASRGILTEIEPRRFALTALGDALRIGAPGAARATVLTLAGDWQWKAWDNFLYSLRTGQPALVKTFEKGLFDYLAANPEDSANFNEAMIGLHGADGPALAAAYDFSSFKTVADLGGGTGILLTTILQSNPHLRGVLIELAKTVPEARYTIETRKLTDRCEVVAGDFFNEVPAGYDGYILAHVLHDWTDEQALLILRNCRKAVASHGRLLVIESVLPPGDTPHQGKMMDLLMMTVTGGIERTAEQFVAVLAEADFKLQRIIPISSHQSILDAVPA
jgi:hypothetical protein